MRESDHCCAETAAVTGRECRTLEIAGVSPGCAMLELAADAGVPAETVYLGAGLLRRVARTDPQLREDLLHLETASGFVSGRVDASDAALTRAMLVYATCVCLANKAYGHSRLPTQRMCLRRWAHELTARLTSASSLTRLEIGCLTALGWRL